MSGTKRTSSNTGAARSHIALLRGVNVGGRNKLPMAAVAEIFADAGAADVRTYIQSGNIVFNASPQAAKKIPSLVAERISADFGVRSPVVLRTADELRQAVAANPFLRAGAAPATLHIAFLAEKPDRKQAGSLDPDRSPGDSFELVGREIYLHLPNGVARTKLTNDYFDSKLGTVSTMRNWRTVLKLVEMTSGGA